MKEKLPVKLEDALETNLYDEGAEENACKIKRMVIEEEDALPEYEHLIDEISDEDEVFKWFMET